MFSRNYVPMSDPEFDKICNLITQSWSKSCVIFIEKITNPTLEFVFQDRIEQLTELGVHFEIKKLFHGTGFNAIDKICKDGFKLEYNKRSAHGIGTYFSDRAFTSAGYLKDVDEDKVSYMFYNDVIIYDPAVLNSNNFNVVVAENCDCIPRYIIGFYKNAPV